MWQKMKTLKFNLIHSVSETTVQTNGTNKTTVQTRNVVLKIDREKERGRERDRGEGEGEREKGGCVTLQVSLNQN